MRVGWSNKDAQSVLGLKSEAKVSQALTPAVEKIAKLWKADPTKTMNMLLAEVAQLNAKEWPELSKGKRGGNIP